MGSRSNSFIWLRVGGPWFFPIWDTQQIYEDIGGKSTQLYKLINKIKVQPVPLSQNPHKSLPKTMNLDNMFGKKFLEVGGNLKQIWRKILERCCLCYWTLLITNGKTSLLFILVGIPKKMTRILPTHSWSSGYKCLSKLGVFKKSDQPNPTRTVWVELG